MRRLIPRTFRGPAYMELFNKLPEGRKSDPPPSSADRKSFQAYRAWQIRSGKAPFPEPELRNMFGMNPDGSVGDYKASTPAIHKAFGDATLAYVNRWNKNLLTTPGGVRLVDIPGADHYVFISNEKDIESELKAFLKQLR